MLLPSLPAACSTVRFNTFFELLGDRVGEVVRAASEYGVCAFPFSDSARPSLCGEVSIVVPAIGFCSSGCGGDADISWYTRNVAG